MTKFNDESVVLRFQAAVATEELVLVATEDEEREDELNTLLDDEVAGFELDAVTALDELAAVPQPVPLTTGISADADPLLPWKPNSTYWPGWIVLFQFRLVAV